MLHLAMVNVDFLSSSTCIDFHPLGGYTGGGFFIDTHLLTLLNKKISGVFFNSVMSAWTNPSPWSI